MQVERLSYSEELLSEILGIEEAHITDKKLCLRSLEQDIIKCLCSNCSCGVFQNGKLVAFSLCYHSDYCTGYVEKCFVLPEFRGHGLQKMMLEYNLAALVDKYVDEVFTMVSSANIASKRSFESVGFNVKKSVVFEGVERIIMKKEL